MFWFLLRIGPFFFPFPWNIMGGTRTRMMKFWVTFCVVRFLDESRFSQGNTIGPIGSHHPHIGVLCSSLNQANPLSLAPCPSHLCLKSQPPPFGQIPSFGHQNMWVGCLLNQWIKIAFFFLLCNYILICKKKLVLINLEIIFSNWSFSMYTKTMFEN